MRVLLCIDIPHCSGDDEFIHSVSSLEKSTMSQLFRTWLLTLAVLALTQGTTQAQVFGSNLQRGYQPYPRAPLNPALNLIRGGNTAANYFLGTVPQRQQQLTNQQFLSGLNQLRLQEQQQIQQRSSEPAFYVPLGGTGHPATFQNYGGYYQFTTGTRIGIPSTGPTSPSTSGLPR